MCVSVFPAGVRLVCGEPEQLQDEEGTAGLLLGVRPNRAAGLAAVGVFGTPSALVHFPSLPPHLRLSFSLSAFSPQLYVYLIGAYSASVQKTLEYDHTAMYVSEQRTVSVCLCLCCPLCSHPCKHLTSAVFIIGRRSRKWRSC